MSARRRRGGVAGKTAVVTGAARGLGEALAHQLSARGARLALVGLEPEELKRVSAALPGESALWHADVSDHRAMNEVVRQVTADLGGVDIVVANAGVGLCGGFEDCEEETWRRVIEVNLLGSAVTCRAFLPALRESRGYYLQIASLAAIIPGPLMTAYCASKSGAEAFTHSLRAEAALHGVGVGVAYLSWTDTDMVRGPDGRTVVRASPLLPTAARLADGIERRAPHVYGQPWIRATQALRGFFPALTGGPRGQSRLRRMPAQRSAALARSGLAGPGGKAAQRASPLPAAQREGEERARGEEAAGSL